MQFTANHRTDPSHLRRPDFSLSWSMKPLLKHYIRNIDYYYDDNDDDEGDGGDGGVIGS